MTEYARPIPKAVLFDRDGTLVHDVPYNGDPARVEPGHVACLREAATLGDVLFVGLNTDDGVRALKGPGRPVNGLVDRAAVLAALGGVDHIVPFEGLTALELVHAVRPDVYVKGGDHDAEALVEAPAVLGYGGRVHLTEALPDHSTTQVIVACSVAAREAVTARDGRDGGLEHVAGPVQGYEVLDLGSPAAD